MFSLLFDCNGNHFTKLMHLLVFHELQRQRVNKNPEIFSIIPERTVLLEKHGAEREGRFDFLVEARDKTIGFEVLTRPSQGKLKQKLAYANEVDEFVFVLPHESLDLYKKKKLNGFKRVGRKKFLSKEFSSPKLKVWLLDPKQGRITEKGAFPEIFDVK